MITDPERLTVAIGDSDAAEDAEEMKKRIKDKFNPMKIMRVDMGTVVGTHLGPGGIGITFYEN